MGIIKIAIGMIFVFIIIKGFDMVVEDGLNILKQWFLRTSIYNRYSTSSKTIKWLIRILVAFMVIISVTIYITWIAPSFEIKTTTNEAHITETIQPNSTKENKISVEIKEEKKDVNSKIEELAQIYIETQRTVNKIALSAAEGKITTENAERLIKAVNEKNLNEEELKELILILKDYKTTTDK